MYQNFIISNLKSLHPISHLYASILWQELFNIWWMIDLSCFNRYLQSGSDVITTATYQASIEGFVKYLGLRPEEAQQMIISGVQLAKETVREFMSHSPVSGVCKSSSTKSWILSSFWKNVETPATIESKKWIIPPEDRREPVVAGSVGPYGAFLHDGSEYTGAYEDKMTVEVMQDEALCPPKPPPHKNFKCMFSLLS